MDITTNKDVELLVNTFYSKVVEDNVLVPFFKNLNLKVHMPKMIEFWEFVLLDKAGYKTDVTEKHMHMRLKKEHFDQWVFLFNETVDALFEGEKAELAKQRAFLVGWTIQSKMK
tara:strand:+ start:572 stop:913 length:342 start_codon:yes stop_codon:yes gene_type:complete